MVIGTTWVNLEVPDYLLDHIWHLNKVAIYSFMIAITGRLKNRQKVDSQGEQDGVCVIIVNTLQTREPGGKWVNLVKFI